MRREGRHAGSITAGVLCSGPDLTAPRVVGPGHDRAFLVRCWLIAATLIITSVVTRKRRGEPEQQARVSRSSLKDRSRETEILRLAGSNNNARAINC